MIVAAIALIVSIQLLAVALCKVAARADTRDALMRFDPDVRCEAWYALDCPPTKDPDTDRLMLDYLTNH